MVSAYGYELSSANNAESFRVVADAPKCLCHVSSWPGKSTNIPCVLKACAANGSCHWYMQGDCPGIWSEGSAQGAFASPQAPLLALTLEPQERERGSFPFLRPTPLHDVDWRRQKADQGAIDVHPCQLVIVNYQLSCWFSSGAGSRSFLCTLLSGESCGLLSRRQGPRPQWRSLAPRAPPLPRALGGARRQRQPAPKPHPGTPSWTRPSTFQPR